MHSWLHWCVVRATAQDPLHKTHTTLKLLIKFEQEGLHFYFATTVLKALQGNSDEVSIIREE